MGGEDTAAMLKKLRSNVLRDRSGGTPSPLILPRKGEGTATRQRKLKRFQRRQPGQGRARGLMQSYMAMRPILLSPRVARDGVCMEYGA